MEVEVEVEVEECKRWRWRQHGKVKWEGKMWRQGKSGRSEVEWVCSWSFRNIDPIKNLACPSAYLYEANHPDKPPKLYKTP